MLPVNRFGKLQQLRGDNTVANYSLWEEETVLGRDPLKCTIVAPEQCTKVSRIHAVIRREIEGIILEDLASHNGTYLNGTRISGKVVLQDKVSFILGGTGNSDKECCYTFREIEVGSDEVDTTEDGTRPKSSGKPLPSATERAPEYPPTRTSPTERR